MIAELRQPHVSSRLGLCGAASSSSSSSSSSPNKHAGSGEVDEWAPSSSSSSSSGLGSSVLPLSAFPGFLSDVSPPGVILERMRLLVLATLFGLFLDAGHALQIQCYQCEEMKHNDCSTPEYIVNCTVNVQDMCQKEVLVKPDGIHYRKSCASSGACLIASSGYQQFCTGKLNSVCITCCNTPLCNGPKRKRPVPSTGSTKRSLLFLTTLMLLPLV